MTTPTLIDRKQEGRPLEGLPTDPEVRLITVRGRSGIGKAAKAVLGKLGRDGSDPASQVLGPVRAIIYIDAAATTACFDVLFRHCANALEDESADTNVTPLVDVMLVLVVIFMVVTPLLRRRSR